MEKDYATRILLLILFCFLLANLAAAKYYFITDDQSPATDVVILTSVVLELENITANDYGVALLSEMEQPDFDTGVTVFIYQGKAMIIIGGMSSPDERGYVDDMGDYLLAYKGIKPLIVASSEIEGIDMRELLFPSEDSVDDNDNGGVASPDETGEGTHLCRDTDGTNYFTFGNVNFTAVALTSIQSVSYNDECADNFTVKEFFCPTKASLDVAYVECEFGCFNGSCRREAAIIIAENVSVEESADEAGPEQATDTAAQQDAAIENKSWWGKFVDWLSGLFS